MSAGTVSGPDAGRGRAETIYVALLDEGLDVWRLPAARRLSNDTFLTPDQEYDREVETRAFEPERVVRCRGENRGGDPLLIASEAIWQAAAT